MTRNNYFTPPQSLILLTGSYIMAIACESVLVYYIYKWNAFKQRRRVRCLSCNGFELSYALRPGAASEGQC